MLKEGDKAPDLLGLDENGNQVKRSDYPGRRIALYFYPKDSTSGCTAQACNLRDNYTELLDAGYQVIGVSVDPAASHIKFRAKTLSPSPSSPTPIMPLWSNSEYGAKSRCMAVNIWAHSAPPSSSNPTAPYRAS